MSNKFLVKLSNIMAATLQNTSVCKAPVRGTETAESWFLTAGTGYQLQVPELKKSIVARKRIKVITIN